MNLTAIDPGDVVTGSGTTFSEPVAREELLEGLTKSSNYMSDRKRTSHSSQGVIVMRAKKLCYICSVVGVGLSIGLLGTHFFKKIKNEDNPAFSNGSLLNHGYKVKMTYQLHYLVEAPLYRHHPLAATKLWTCTPSIPSCLVERYLVNSKYFPTPSAGVDLYCYVDAAHAASKRKPERSHRNLPRPHER